MLVAGASGLLALLFGVGQYWQQEGGEDGNYRDDDQQFDEGESSAHSPGVVPWAALQIPLLFSRGYQSFICDTSHGYQ
jgi:hypothetical protein